MRIVPSLIAVVLAGCSRPEPPVVTPQKSRVTRVDATGLEVETSLSAHNPNRVDLSARSVTASVVLDGVPLGSVTADKPVTLPAGRTLTLTVPLAVKWSSLPALFGVATKGGDVPYAIDGTVDIGGEVLHASVPFHVAGKLTQVELRRAFPRPL